MKIFFACDLDNTLIHSSKRKRDGDICVEMYNGNEQSFMSPRTYELLQEIVKTVTLVPLTTRSVEQYNRIEWEDNVKPKYAITTNGAILFEDGNPNIEWNDYSKTHSDEYREELEKIVETLDKQNRFSRCRIVDDRYAYGHFKPEVDIEECLTEYFDFDKVNVQLSGRKIYFFPTEICKGNAVSKFGKKFGADLVICAGDSTIDVPMFKFADIGYAPNSELVEDIKDLTKGKIVCRDDETLFSEFILEDILKVVKDLNKNNNN